MKKHYTHLNYLGLPIFVEYSHIPYYPQTLETPEEPEEVEVTKIEIEGHNIYELVSEQHFKAISSETLSKHRQDIAERPIYLSV